MSQPNSISYHPKYDRTEPKAAAGSSDLDNMFGDKPTESVVQSREEDEGLVF